MTILTLGCWEDLIVSYFSFKKKLLGVGDFG